MDDWEICNSSKKQTKKIFKILNEVIWADFVVFHFLTLLYKVSEITFINFADPKQYSVPDSITEFNISM